MDYEHPKMPPSLPIPYDDYRYGYPVVDVVVDEWTYTVHQSLFRASSNYFAGLLDETTGQDNNNVRIDITAETLEGLNCYGLVNTYLYTGELFSPQGLYFYQQDYRELCHVWLFAYSYRMPELLNYAMWFLLKRINEGNEKILGSTIEELYQHTPRGSKLHKALLDIIVWKEPLYEPTKKAPRQMGWELYKTMKQKEKANQSPLLDVASYYMKGEDLPPVTAEAAARVTCTSIIWETETEAESEEETTPNKKFTPQYSSHNKPPTNKPFTKQTPPAPPHATVESDAEPTSAPHTSRSPQSNSSPAEQTSSKPQPDAHSKKFRFKTSTTTATPGRNIQRPVQSVRCP